MSETPLTTGIQSIPGPFPDNPQAITNQLKVIFEASDSVAGNSFPFTGKDVLLIHNSHATIAYTFTLVAQADDQKRKVNIGPITVTAGDTHMFDFTGSPVGWRDVNANVLLQSNNAAILFAVLKHS